jgi:hypothetical protein
MINNSNILIYQNGNIKAIFEEYELDKEVVVRNYRTTTKYRTIEGRHKAKRLNNG